MEAAGRRLHRRKRRALIPSVLVACGAVYLGYVVAWLFAVQSNQLIGIDDRFSQAMSQFGEFFAIVSPALWFFATLSLVRSPMSRIVVLAIGLVVLFPFPLFFGVTPQ
ncbi:MAG: hypothetical protein F2785_02785 [Actinobacteria bacterium]|nr:hypothetical protein [Actinomycetota bacterium]